MTVTTRTVTYNGRPCMEFKNGTGKPFSFGAYKLKVMLTALPQVRAWLTAQGETIPQQAQTQVAESPAVAQSCRNTLPSDVFQAIKAQNAIIENLQDTVKDNDSRLSMHHDLGSRIETLEATIGIILEEITKAATIQPTINTGHRLPQLD